MTGRSFARGMLVTAFGNFVPPLAALITAPILAHSLGVTGRGEVSAAQAPLLLFGALFTLGLPEAATYLVARSPRLLGLLVGKASLILAIAGAVGTVLMMAMADVLAGGDSDVALLIRLSALAIGPTLIVTLARGAAMGLQAWGLIASERSLSSLGRLGAIVVLELTDQLTVLAAVYVNAWHLLLGAVVYLLLAIRPVRTRLASPQSAADDDARIGGLLRYGMGVWFGSLAGVLLARVDQLLLVPLAGTYELGLYAVAVVIAEIPLLLNNTVREVMFAADARARDDDRLTYAARVSGCICLVTALAIATTMWWWLPIAFGADFAPALPVTLVLLLAVVVGPPGSVAGAGLAARGLPRLRSWSLLFALIVNLVVVILLVPTLGAMGAAVATVAGNLISSNANIYFMHKRFSIPMKRFYALTIADVRTFAKTVASMIRRRGSE